MGSKEREYSRKEVMKWDEKEGEGSKGGKRVGIEHFHHMSNTGADLDFL